ncbi:MAG: hypothetical protein KDC87_21270 [Planctomycetes bacterium]|nr:hypothetical protein [Planctomycetota bacterium]
MSKLEIFRDFLLHEGYRPQAHDDFLSFRHEGAYFLLPADDSDPTFFQVVLPNFWRFGTPAEAKAVRDTAAAITGSLKAVKVIAGPENVNASFETVLTDPDAFGEVFGRALQSLQFARMQFCAVMHARSSAELGEDGV